MIEATLVYSTVSSVAALTTWMSLPRHVQPRHRHLWTFNHFLPIV